MAFSASLLVVVVVVVVVVDVVVDVVVGVDSNNGEEKKSKMAVEVEGTKSLPVRIRFLVYF